MHSKSSASVQAARARAAAMEQPRSEHRQAGADLRYPFYFGQHFAHVPFEKSSWRQHHSLDRHVTAATKVWPPLTTPVDRRLETNPSDISASLVRLHDAEYDATVIIAGRTAAVRTAGACAGASLRQRLLQAELPRKHESTHAFALLEVQPRRQV